MASSQKQAASTLAELSPNGENAPIGSMEFCPMPAWLSDASGSRIYFNQAWFDFTGRTPVCELGDSWKDGVHPDDLDVYLEAYTNAHTHAHEYPNPLSTEKRVLGADNEYRWISTKGCPQYNIRGEFTGLVGYCFDITDQKKVEQKLRNKKQRFELALEATGLGIWDWNIVTGEMVFNRRFTEILGFEYNEMERRFGCLDDLIHPEDSPIVREKLQRHLEGRSSIYESEHRIKTKYGDWVWVQDRGKVVQRDSSGKPLRMTGTHRDTTMRKEMEDSMQRLSLVASRANIGVVIANAEGCVEWVNYAFERMSGYDLFDLEGKRAGVLLQGPGSDPEVISQMRECIRQKKEFHTEILNYHKSGQPYWVEIDATPIFDMKGKAIQYIAIESDITARKAAEQEMKKAKEAAESANRAKSDFLANMSHEIRTPMNAVMGMTTLLLDTDLNDDQLDFAKTIQTSNESLLNVINDILDFSKIESGKLDLEDVAYSLTSCVEEAMELFGPKAAETGLELLSHIDDHVPEYVIGDPTRLRQILINLVGNAMKFTARGEVVATVTLDEMQGEDYLLRFSVRDTGIGIPKARQDILFEAFSQVDSSTTRQYGGTGLGLVISKRLCQLMGGDIGLQSEEGKGSEFYFTIKLKPDKSPPSSTLQTGPLNGKRVLIIDDNATNRQILTLLLSNWGIYSEEAQSGPEALSLLDQREPFDAAILDYQMPKMDGLTLATEIRESAAHCKLPLIMLASLAHPDAVKLRSQLDFTAYLTKPVRKQFLMNALRQAFQGPNKINTRVNGRSESPFRNLPSASTSTFKLLLAEDNVVNQKVVLLLLKRLGYRADVVDDGQKALQYLENESCDMILMDMQMPNMDGIEATRRIREKFANNQQPYIIALTAAATVKDKNNCLESGMNTFLTKPIKIQELAEALKVAQDSMIAKRRTLALPQ